MGYLRPTAIIVSADYEDYKNNNRHWIDIAHEKAISAFKENNMAQLVSPIVFGIVNNERSFLIAWDGSKEGWPHSDQGDECREKFVTWLREQAYDDGSSPLDWVELQYGGDDDIVVALSHPGQDREEVK